MAVSPSSASWNILCCFFFPGLRVDGDLPALVLLAGRGVVGQLVRLQDKVVLAVGGKLKGEENERRKVESISACYTLINYK